MRCGFYIEATATKRTQRILESVIKLMLLKMTQAKAEHLLFQKVVFAERDNEIGGNLQSGLAS